MIKGQQDDSRTADGWWAVIAALETAIEWRPDQMVEEIPEPPANEKLRDQGVGCFTSFIAGSGGEIPVVDFSENNTSTDTSS